MAKPVDDPAALRRLLDESGVSSQVTEHIASQGYTTIALLGYAVPKADALEDFVKFLTPSADGSEFQPFSPQVACLRRAVEVFRCHPERPWNWQPVSCTRGWSYYSGLASSTQSLGTTTIFGNPSENLGTATSFGRSSESGLQGWWWAECPIKTSATSDVAEILRDLCFWQSLSPSMSIAELTEKITTAGWYSLLLSKLKEGVTFVTGCPNSGKSTLAVNIATCLGLVKTRTSSRNFWLFSKDDRPFFSICGLQIQRRGVQIRCIDYWGPSCPFVPRPWASFIDNGDIVVYGSNHAGAGYPARVNQKAQVAHIKDVWENWRPQLLWGI